MPPKSKLRASPGKSDKRRRGNKDSGTKKKNKGSALTVTQPLTTDTIERTPRGAHASLQQIRGLDYPFPRKPAKDMDATIVKYAMEVDISQIQPFERLRALLGFFTTESSRALVDIAVWRSHQRSLKRAIDQRTASQMASTSSTSQWRAKAIVRDDKKIQKWQSEWDTCEDVIDILDALFKTYSANVVALSREQTARQGDKDRYYGRGGGATA